MDGLRLKENWIQGCYLCFFAVALLFSVAGELRDYEKNGFDSHIVQVLNTGWTRVYPDGGRAPQTVPASGRHENHVSIERRLPERLPHKDSYLYLRSMHQDVYVDVNGSEIYRYVFRDNSFFGKGAAPVQWLRIPIEDVYVGGILSITLEREGLFMDDPLDDIYLGQETAILYRLLRRELPQLAAAAFLMVIAINSLIEYLVFRREKTASMGLYLLLIGVWLFSQNNVRQFFFDNVILIRNLEFISMLLLPVPALMAINELEEGKYRDEIHCFCIISLSMLLITMLLYAFTPLSFFELFVIPELGIMLSAAYVCGSFIRLKRDDKKLFEKLRHVVVAHISLITAGILELVLLNLMGSRYNGWIMAAGAIGFGIEMQLTYEKRYRSVLNEKELMERSERAKSEFFASMSHEIRSPINAVLGMNELILRDSNEDRIRSFARDINTAGQSLLSIVNEILEFSRLESGQSKNIEKPFHFGELIYDITTVARFRAEQRGLDFYPEIEDGLPAELVGNVFWLREILMNLLDNAVKYTEKGSVRLSVGLCSESEAGLKLESRLKEASILRLSVKDTGIGISEGKQQCIFQSFTRESEYWSGYIQGTGLGLSITRQYAEAMHGRVTLESKLGEGSVFTVYLPMLRDGKETLGSFSDYSAAFKDNRREDLVCFTAKDVSILVADDNVLNLRLMRELLSPTGIEVWTVTSGSAALDMLSEKSFDLVLLDDLMQGWTGVEALLHIRERGYTSKSGGKLPVVCYTANAMPGARESYLAQGFTAYLPKPADRYTIAECLLGLLPQSKLQRREENSLYIEERNEAEPVLLDSAVGMKYCMEDENIYREIIEVFCDAAEEKISSLSAALEGENWENYRLYSHSMKTSALTIGGMKLSALSRKLEHAAGKCRSELAEEREDAIEYIHARNKALIELIRETSEAAGKLLEEYSESP